MNAADTQSPEDKALVTEVIDGILKVWEPYHRKWMDRANHFYSLYSNVQDLRSSVQSSSSPRGRDLVFRDGETEFGPELFIPMAFSTVETILPAMLSASPKMGVRPRNPFSEANVYNVRAMLEAQQEQIKYPLRLQTIAKDGLITGTGVQKTYWRRDLRMRKVNQPDLFGGAQMVEELQELFDDPDAAAVDPFDFIVDPFCASIEFADGAFHRTWRSTRYIKRMVETHQWRNLDELKVATGDPRVLGGDGTQRYSEVWAQRRMIGDRDTIGAGGDALGKSDVHEVLEFHDGDRVVTILNRQVVVASGDNPNWHGRLPFQVFRPTENPHQLHGKGEIEPIEHLQEELNTLRTQRRYNADLVLQRVFAYHEGMVEKEDIQFGPGWAIGVNGDPREMLFPIQVGDIPYSGYQEEDRLVGDFDRTTGISDVIAGAGLSGADTATGVQMVASAASRRIEGKTARLSQEVVDPGAEQFLELSQQRRISNKTIRVPSPPTPEEPDRRWSWVELGPNQIMGEFEVAAIDGSMQPANIPQDRADANMLMTIFGQIPTVEQSKVVEKALELMGIEDPRAWLAPPNPTVPAEVLNRLVEFGVPDQMIAQALAQVGGPDLLAGATLPEPEAAAGPGPEPPSEGGPPVTPPLELPPAGGTGESESASV